MSCCNELWELKTKHPVYYLLGLIATLTLVSGDCDVRTQKTKYFDWTKVGISLL